MLIYALIGTPQGIEINPKGNKDLYDLVKNNLSHEIDLKNRYVTTVPNEELLMIKRKMINGKPLYYFALYRFAQEINSNREGAYYGSVIILDVQANVEHIIDSLRLLASVVKDNLIKNNRFHAHIANFDIPVSDHLGKLIKMLSEVVISSNTNFKTSKKPAFVQFEGQNGKTLLSEIMEGKSYNEYDTIYLSSGIKTQQFSRGKKSLIDCFVFSTDPKRTEIPKTETPQKIEQPQPVIPPVVVDKKEEVIVSEGKEEIKETVKTYDIFGQQQENPNGLGDKEKDKKNAKKVIMPKWIRNNKKTIVITFSLLIVGLVFGIIIMPKIDNYLNEHRMTKDDWRKENERILEKSRRDSIALALEKLKADSLNRKLIQANQNAKQKDKKAEESSKTKDKSKEQQKKEKLNFKNEYYTLQSGEGISSVQSYYNKTYGKLLKEHKQIDKIDQKRIKELNPELDFGNLQLGQKIIISVPFVTLSEK